MKYYPICDKCVGGEGNECHTPECSFCLSDVPKVSNPEYGVNWRDFWNIAINEAADCKDGNPDIFREKIPKNIIFSLKISNVIFLESSS